MLKNLARAAAWGLIAALAFLATAALAINISGRDTQYNRSILQMGILGIAGDLNVTATPSGTITTSYQITAGITEVVTIATTGDSIKLPNMALFTSGTPGHSLDIIVANHHATNAVGLFPFASAEVIVNNGSAGAAGAALSIPALKTAECYSVPGTVNTWFCQIG
jgi:hypothetical protein